MERLEKRYYLTKEESKELRMNDISPNPAAEEARKAFFEKQDQMNVFWDEKGRICCRTPEIDEKAIAEILEQKQGEIKETFQMVPPLFVFDLPAKTEYSEMDKQLVMIAA